MPTMNVYMLVSDGIALKNDGKKIADVYAGFSGFVGVHRNGAAAADLNVFMASEFFYGANARSKSDRKKVESLTKTLSTGHGNSLIFPGTVVQEKGSGIKNRMPIYFNGNEVLLHTKRSWGGAKKSDGTSGSSVFISGQKDPTFSITINGVAYTCGVEICMDHQAGDLSTHLNGATVDFHFIVGNVVGVDASNLCASKLSIMCNANQAIRSGQPATASQIYDNTGTAVAHTTQTIHEKTWLGVAF